MGKFSEGLLDTDLILKTLDVRAGQSILDAGCGNAYMARIFARTVGPTGLAYALDKDRQFIRALQREAGQTNLRIMLADITSPTPLPEAIMDIVYMSTVIHVFSRQQVAGLVQEVRRLLRPGGKLAVVEIEKKELPFGPPVEQKYSPEELKEIIPLEPAGTVMVAEHFYMQVFRNQ